MNIRVLIADNHPLVRDGLRFCLERDDHGIVVTGEAADGLEALAKAESLRVDVCVFDITMPKMNGLEAMRALLRKRPDAKVIILSFHDSRAVVEEAMQSGARGYLTKESASDHIVEAIRAVHAGRFFLSPDVGHYMIEKALRGAGGGPAAVGAALTDQERAVLHMIVEGRTSKEIAALLGCAVTTVQTHRKHLMSKLGIHKQTELVHYAIREGLAKR